MKDLRQIQVEVGEWAKNNFGRQESKCSPGLVLDSLAPLLGIGEEIGEFFEAVKQVDSYDALGDIGIYLCDYATREGVDLEATLSGINELHYKPVANRATDLMLYYGKLVHCTLKRHQGIRGFDNPTSYVYHRNRAIYGILICLKGLCPNFMQVLNETWDKVVAKRNWKTSPKNGTVDNLHPMPDNYVNRPPWHEEPLV